MNEGLNLIIGNLSSAVALGVDCVAATRKTAKGLLLVQSVGLFFYFLSTMVLKGYSGAVQNAIGILRNFAAIKNIDNPFVTWTLVGTGAAVGIWVNNLGLVGYMPVIANVVYTLGVFRFKNNERALKLCLLSMVALYGAFNIVIQNYAGAVGNVIIIITTAMALIKSAKAQKAAE